MCWKLFFEQGISLFKEGKNKEALEKFNQAIANGGENQFILYDSRAAVHELLNHPKDALRDAKKTIEVAPKRWHGYARSARLFLKTARFDPALKMVDMALQHVKPNDEKRREELEKLKNEILEARQAMEQREKRRRNYIAHLPVETYGEIFQILVSEDYTEVVRLSHVCRQWREMIWSMPSLWSTLVLSNLKPEKKIAFWLERSKNRIRELIFRDTHEHYIAPAFLLKLDWSSIRILRIHSHRLAHTLITLFFSNTTLFLNLEELEIVDYPCPSALYPRLAAGVRKLTLKGWVDWYSLADHVQSLTSLHVINGLAAAYHLPQDLTRILLANPNLESLQFDCITYGSIKPFSLSDNTDPPPSPIRISLPKLTLLESKRNPEWSSQLLSIDMPALRILRLEEASYTDLNQQFKNWISSSPQCLTELCLKKVTIDKATILEIVKSVQTIEVLALVGLYQTVNAVLIALVEGVPALGDKRPCLCPKLKHLDVSDCADVETSRVFELVEQRLTLAAKAPGGKTGHEGVEGQAGEEVTVNRLEVLKMNGCPKIDVNWLPWFRERVPEVSCLYSTGKAKKGMAKRVNGI